MTGGHYIIHPARARPFRPRTPTLVPAAFHTYAVQPWWTRATCAEVDCDHWADGWSSTVPTGSPQAAYIRAESGRRFTETPAGDGLVRFDFPAGQMCFAAATHKRHADRPARYVRQAGDWRARIGPARVYDRADQWVDDLATQVERITGARSRAGTADP